ncbi:MAG: undecaprenyl-diphosphate phosphatase [Proteobacteria bacterium]|nr:undecaprenyl-diphosphate phosphatase [Pseudomonadota bacterium]
MDPFDIIALALIQGITEFLPVSSSGHLVLWPLLTGRPDQGVTMDVAAHLGTLAAVCLYFKREAGELVTGLADVLRGRTGTNAARLFGLIALATLPALVAGLALKLTGWIDALRALEVIGWATLLGGLLLWYADRVGPQRRDAGGWRLHDAILMGLAQALALVPGTSRSGITMTMARFLGFERAEAARLSLLMAMPVILAAGVLETAGLVRGGNLALSGELALGAALSFVAALGALSVMMRMFRRDWTMLPFVLYRLALGLGLLALAYG